MKTQRRRNELIGQKSKQLKDKFTILSEENVTMKQVILKLQNHLKKNTKSQKQKLFDVTT